MPEKCKINLIIGISKLSEILGVSKPTISQYIKLGMPCGRVGNRWHFHLTNVDKWLLKLTSARYEGKAVLKGVYVDYLDLLRAGQVFDLHRLEMGQVTIDMKVAAVMQGIPWVTVTQLNRGAYDPKENLSLANMSESIKKVEHSDFVGILKNLTQEIDPDQDVRIEVADGDFRIIRGGSWRSEARFLRSAFRDYRTPNHVGDNLGFRCARDVAP